jgi:DNA-binding LytR/AlgR family response regulator
MSVEKALRPEKGLRQDRWRASETDATFIFRSQTKRRPGAPAILGAMDVAGVSFSRCEPEPLAVTLPQTPEQTAGEADSLEQRSMMLRSKPGRIAVRIKRRILLIDPADLIAVEAKGNYVRLHFESSSYELRESMSVMDKQLQPYGFVQIHRSVLVNAAWVEELQPRPAGQYLLRVRGGRQYTVTRTYKENLQQLALAWIG